MRQCRLVATLPVPGYLVDVLLPGGRKDFVERDFADFVFGQFAEREFAARELLLRKSPQKIRLIFCSIERAKKLEAAGGFIAADAGVVPGSEAIGADLASHAEERFELHIGVAVGAGDGSASAEIVPHERAHDAHQFI